MITRFISEKLLQLAEKFPVVSIMGPRQSGKTTLARELFPEHTYFNLENPDHREAARVSPRDFLRQRNKGIIIDEAQYVPEIFSYVQIEADERNQSGEFILSGSQNFLLMEKITQSLAGRVALFHLLPFSAEELKDTSYHQTSALGYMIQGFYPRLYDKQIAPEDYYPAYIQTYVERDARQVLNIADLGAFQNFIRLCAGRIGQLFNQSELAMLAGVDQKTARRWLSILQTSFLAFTLPPYFRNFDKRIVKTPKLYFWDVGLACSLLGIRSSEALEQHFARGALFENFVIVEILKGFYNRGIRPNAYFWRDSSGNEIDLLLDEGGKIYPIEIKAGQRIHADYFKGLNFFNKLSGVDPGSSYLVYDGSQNISSPQANIRTWDNLPGWE